MAKRPCPLADTAWSAEMQARALFFLLYTDVLCRWWDVTWNSVVTLLSDAQPAARCERGNEPIGNAVGGTPCPLS